MHATCNRHRSSFCIDQCRRTAQMRSGVQLVRGTNVAVNGNSRELLVCAGVSATLYPLNENRPEDCGSENTAESGSTVRLCRSQGAPRVVEKFENRRSLPWFAM